MRVAYAGKESGLQEATKSRFSLAVVLIHN